MPTRIPDSIREVFKAAANDPRYGEVSVEAVHEAACRTALDSGVATEAELPSIEWTYRFVRPFRKYRHPWLDAPWSMGAMSRAECDIEPSALTAVLWIWKWGLARGKRITNREAMWVSRLHPLLHEENEDAEPSALDSLFGWAIRYAQEERAAEVLNEPLDTTVLDMWMATANQFSSKSWADPEPFEQLARDLLDDTGGLDVLDWGSQIDRARGNTQDYEKFPFDEDSVSWPQADTTSSDVGPLVRLMDRVTRDNGWVEPSTIYRELLILGLRELARWDHKWQEIQGDFPSTNGVPDETVIAACSTDVSALIDILDEFKRSADRDFGVWELSPEGKKASQGGVLTAYFEFERPMNKLSDAFLDKIGSRLRRGGR